MTAAWSDGMAALGQLDSWWMETFFVGGSINHVGLYALRYSAGFALPALLVANALVLVTSAAEALVKIVMRRIGRPPPPRPPMSVHNTRNSLDD